MTALVTGGADYIGSHTVCLLLEQGDEVVVVDNLSNASRESLRRVFRITGKEPAFYEGDILEELFLEKVFLRHDIDSGLHFAGLKAVGESVEKPLLYYKIM